MTPSAASCASSLREGAPDETRTFHLCRKLFRPAKGSLIEGAGKTRQVLTEGVCSYLAYSPAFQSQAGYKSAPAPGCRETPGAPLGGKLVRHLHNEPPADALAPQRLGCLPAGHVGLPVRKGIGPYRADRFTSLPQRPHKGFAAGALCAKLGVKVILLCRIRRVERPCHIHGRGFSVKGQSGPERLVCSGQRQSLAGCKAEYSQRFSFAPPGRRWAFVFV